MLLFNDFKLVVNTFAPYPFIKIVLFDDVALVVNTFAPYSFIKKMTSHVKR